VSEGDRRTFTITWVAVTLVAATILLVFGNPWYALAFTVVAGVGLVAFLRATHPRGAQKPNLNIFFDDLEPGDEGDGSAGGVEPGGAAAPIRVRPTTAPTAEANDAEVIDLRQTARREPAPSTLDEVVATSDEASRSAGTAMTPAPAGSEVADELSAHHVRLLRKVETQLRDYE
jgi:hypothetical protein